jgi:putrescine transport system substrate-binding protein
MRQVESSDPGNRHGAIYLWGTMGLGVNVAKVKAVAPDAPLDSWDLLFRPENAKRIAACGITMMDSAIDVIPSVLKFLRLNPDSNAPDDLAAAERALLAIRPSIRSFASGGALEALATGQTCLAFDYSGDVRQAATRAVEAKQGDVIRYVAPREGVEVGFDMLAIPADAPHKEAAHAFIDFVLRPKVMASISNVTHYPNAVPASRPMLEDASVIPSDDEMARYFTIGPVPQAAERLRTRLWARFKAGN